MIDNNKLTDSETGIDDSEVSSDSSGGNRKLWVTAQEIAGLDGMPTTDRRVRDLLEQWAGSLDGVKRKRKGTKAFEYHISILPKQVAGVFSHSYDIPPVSFTTISEANRGTYSEQNFLDEFAMIPGYRVQVSAGHGTVAIDGEEPCRHLAFRRKWLKWRGFSEKELVIVWCKGESMEPAIYNNDTLVVHTGQTKPVDGGIYVLRNHDQLWVKRIQSLPSAWVLLSDNPRYPPIEVPKDEQHNFQIVGKVVHISHDLD